MSDIISLDQPKLAGAKLGEKIILSLVTNRDVHLVLTEFNHLGVEGVNINVKDATSKFYPWASIICVTKGSNE